MKEIVLITFTPRATQNAPPLLQRALSLGTTYTHIASKDLAVDLYFEAVYRAVQNKDPDIAGFIFVGERQHMITLAQTLDRKFIKTRTERVRPIFFTSDDTDTLFASLCAATAVCLYGERNIYIADGGIHLAWQYQESTAQTANVRELEAVS